MTTSRSGLHIFSRRRVRALATAGLCFLSVERVASADEEPISADRPGFAESTDVVGDKVLQIEAGLNLDHDSLSRGYEETFTTPTLLRFGLGERFELQLATDGRTVVHDHDPGASQTTRGYSDLTLGAKWSARQADDGDSGPSVAALVQADVDSGSAEFRGDGIRPSVRVPVEWELPGNMAAGIMPGVIYDKDEHGRFVNGLLAITTDKQWNSRWHSFFEIAAEQIARAADGGCLVIYDAGATYLVSNDMQLDIEVSHGANDNTPEWTFGTGLAVRF
jgi:hypothetical protein